MSGIVGCKIHLLGVHLLGVGGGEVAEERFGTFREL